MMETNKPFFAPQLYIPSNVKNIDFYTRAFGAVEMMSFKNDDGSYHVAELSIDGTIFHVHESHPSKEEFDPVQNKGTTVLVGLFVSDVQAVMNAAIAAGAEEISPVTDYEYGYRQGRVKDPFGHHWMIEKKI